MALGDQVIDELGEEGVRAVLEHPPTGSSAINLPHTWIDHYRRDTHERYVLPDRADAVTDEDR